MKVIDETMGQLVDAGLTAKQLKLTRHLIARYAFASLTSSFVAEEAKKIFNEHYEKVEGNLS